MLDSTEPVFTRLYTTASYITNYSHLVVSLAATFLSSVLAFSTTLWELALELSKIVLKIVFFYCRIPRLSPLLDPVVLRIAEAHEKTPAQVLLRHLLQLGLAVIPKSANPERIRQNFQVLSKIN